MGALTNSSFMRTVSLCQVFIGTLQSAEAYFTNGFSTMDSSYELHLKPGLDLLLMLNQSLQLFLLKETEEGN